MKHVLLVDDESMVRIGVKTCVDWESLHIDTVYEASNGAEALEIIRNHHIDVIITDIKMSVMDGFAMLEELKTISYKPDVIVMSCYNDYENMRKAMAYGVKDFLFKPKMYPDDIAESIRKIQGDISDKEKGLEFQLQELIQSMTQENYQEAYLKLYQLFSEYDLEMQTAVQSLLCFLNRLMEMDDTMNPLLHVFSTALFRNLYEIKKCRKKAELLIAMKGVLKQSEHEQKRKIKEELYHAMQYIDLHLSDPELSQDMVAEYVGLSVSYFCRLFKNESGMSYSSYITKKRIELAEELYRTTDMKINEIAKEIGYTNERYFARIYKEQTGHSMKNLGRFDIEKEQ